jgi:hypothetical protein
VLEDVEPGRERRQRMREIRRAITVDAPVDVFVTDVGECNRRRDVPGSIRIDLIAAARSPTRWLGAARRAGPQRP